MFHQESHEKILISIALILCALIVGYNSFFVPVISTPTLVYTDYNSSQDNTQSSEQDCVKYDIKDDGQDNEKTEINSYTKTENKDNHEYKNVVSSRSISKVNKDEKRHSSQTIKKTKANNIVVNINTAAADELSDNLKGIGPTISQRIIEYRKSNGKFNSIEDIKNVKGIGDKKFEKIRNNITV